MKTTLPLLLFATVMQCSCNVAPMFVESRESTETLDPGKGIHVESMNGYINVNQADVENVEIISHIRALSEERANGTVVLAGKKVDGTLHIRVQWPDGKREGREGASFEIKVPAANGLKLESSNGHLETRGLSGLADLHTSNGHIKIHHHDGPVKVHTSNGKVVVADVKDSVDVKTSNGGVEVRMSGAGPLKAKTSNGSVDVKLGDGFAGKMSVKTSNGKLDIQGVPDQAVAPGEKEADLAFGGEGESSVESSNGNITLKVVGAADAEE